MSIQKILDCSLMTKDGHFGIVIRIHNENTGWKPHHAGVQVHGEEGIRWIPFHNIIDAGDGALIEI